MSIDERETERERELSRASSVVGCWRIDVRGVSHSYALAVENEYNIV